MFLGYTFPDTDGPVGRTCSNYVPPTTYGFAPRSRARFESPPCQQSDRKTHKRLNTSSVISDRSSPSPLANYSPALCRWALNSRSLETHYSLPSHSHLTQRRSTHECTAVLVTAPPHPCENFTKRTRRSVLNSTRMPALKHY